MSFPPVSGLLGPNPNRSARLLLLLVALAVLGGGILAAFFSGFTRPVLVDEGYLMITVRGFLGGHPLYDSVFTQYGPFYYFYQALWRGVLGLPLTHDFTRLLCLLHGLFAAVILACTTRRLTRSPAAALGTFCLATLYLGMLANEPGHPQELIVVLLSLALLTGTFVSSSPRAWIVLGVIGAALVCLKINVGLFYLIALFLALRCHSNDLFSRGPWPVLLVMGCALPPFLLARRHLAQPWCLYYALVTAVALVATLLTAQTASLKGSAQRRPWFLLGAAFAGTVVPLLGATLLLGTSVRGLLDGLLLIPLRTPTIALLPLQISGLAALNAVLALAAALYFHHHRARAEGPERAALLKLLYGLAGCFLLPGNTTAQFDFLLPWTWLVLLPCAPGAEANSPGSFARVWLCLLTVWQALQAYPIAGTQVIVGSFPLVVSYLVCLCDAGQSNWFARRWQPAAARLTASSRNLVAALACVIFVYVFLNVWSTLPQLRQLYREQPSLALPGAGLIHVEPEGAAVLRGLTRYLRDESDVFISYPSNNSFYFWTGQQPPTQFNSTGWGLLSLEQQRQILAALRKGDRPLIVVEEFALRIWAGNRPPQILPLVQCVLDESQPVGRVGNYIIFRPLKKSAIPPGKP